MKCTEECECLMCQNGKPHDHDHYLDSRMEIEVNAWLSIYLLSKNHPKNKYIIRNNEAWTRWLLETIAVGCRGYKINNKNKICMQYASLDKNLSNDRCSSEWKRWINLINASKHTLWRISLVRVYANSAIIFAARKPLIEVDMLRFDARIIISTHHGDWKMKK